jgi:hypothetical protein
LFITNDMLLNGTGSFTIIDITSCYLIQFWAKRVRSEYSWIVYLMRYNTVLPSPRSQGSFCKSNFYTQFYRHFVLLSSKLCHLSSPVQRQFPYPNNSGECIKRKFPHTVLECRLPPPPVLFSFFFFFCMFRCLPEHWISLSLPATILLLRPEMLQWWPIINPTAFVNGLPCRFALKTVDLWRLKCRASHKYLVFYRPRKG